MRKVIDNTPPRIREIRARLRSGTITRGEYDELTEWLGHPPQSRPYRNHANAQGATQGMIHAAPTGWPEERGMLSA